MKVPLSDLVEEELRRVLVDFIKEKELSVPCQRDIDVSDKIAFPRKGFFVSELQSTSNDDDNEDDDDGPTKLGAGGCVSGVEGREKKLVSKKRRRLGCHDGD